MKKIVLIIGILMLALIIGIGIYFGVFYERKIEINFEGPIILECDKDATLDEKVTETIMTNCSDKYEGGQQGAEGHIILGTEEKENEIFVYSLATYGKYDSQIDKFTRISGSEITPVVIKLSENENGDVFASITWIVKDANYEKIIKQIFPKEYRERVITISEDDVSKIEELEYEYVKDSFKKDFLSKSLLEQKDFLKSLLEDNNFMFQYPLNSNDINIMSDKF